MKTLTFLPLLLMLCLISCTKPSEILSQNTLTVEGTNDNYSSANDFYNLGRHLYAASSTNQYNLQKAYFYFNTISIPVGSVVTSVKMTIRPIMVSGTGNIHICKGTFTAMPNDDTSKLDRSSIYATFSTADLAVDQYKEITLLNTSVTCGDYTKLCMYADAFSTNYYIDVIGSKYNIAYGTSYIQPTLVITYTAGSISKKNKQSTTMETE